MTGWRCIVTDRGSRVLPGPVETWSTASSWSARLACDADLRERAKPYRELAARLTITPSPVSSVPDTQKD